MVGFALDVRVVVLLGGLGFWFDGVWGLLLLFDFGC